MTNSKDILFAFFSLLIMLMLFGLVLVLGYFIIKEHWMTLGIIGVILGFGWVGAILLIGLIMFIIYVWYIIYAYLKSRFSEDKNKTTKRNYTISRIKESR